MMRIMCNSVFHFVVFLEVHARMERFKVLEKILLTWCYIGDVKCCVCSITLYTWFFNILLLVSLSSSCAFIQLRCHVPSFNWLLFWFNGYVCSHPQWWLGLKRHLPGRCTVSKIEVRCFDISSCVVLQNLYIHTWMHSFRKFSVPDTIHDEFDGKFVRNTLAGL